MERIINPAGPNNAELEYMIDSLGRLDLVLFDRKGDKTWNERIWHGKREYNGRVITVWGM